MIVAQGQKAIIKNNDMPLEIYSLENSGKLPFIRATISNQEIPALLDSGSNVCALQTDFANKYISGLEYHDCNLPLKGVNGAFHAPTYIKTNISLDSEEEIPCVFFL